jgi:mannose-6-phosphate isomerase-like protein (cupin superfamily)
VKRIALLIATMSTISAVAQNAHPAEVFSGKDVAAQLATLSQKAKLSGSSGTTLGDYSSHSIRLSVRTASGGAEMHGHFDDILVVTGGSATLITGGTIVNSHTSADGETMGSRIQDGSSRKILKDDIVHIPASTPHQLILAPGNTFSAIVVKVRE